LNALLTSSIILACVLSAAVLGVFLRSVLPEHHVNEDSKYIFQLGMTLLATLAALVLGLLIASAKTSFDFKQDEIRQSAATIILLDRTLRQYGPETDAARTNLRQLTELNTNMTWIENGTQTVVRTGGARLGIEEVQEKLRALVPATEPHRWLQARALELSGTLAQMRWLMIDQHHSSIPTPFLVALAFWLTVIFCGFGLFAPRHGTIYAVVLVCALSVSSAIFLILELDRPFEGLMTISDAPLRDAIAEMKQ